MPAETARLPEPYVDAVEAAKFLGINPKTVMRWARQGTVPAHPLGTGSRKRWRFLISELDEWLRSGLKFSSHPCRNKEMEI